jgi:hypothetical protein
MATRTLFVLLALYFRQGSSLEVNLGDVLQIGNAYAEDDCLAYLDQNIFDASNINPKYIGLAMNKGFWRCAKEIAKLANSAGIDVRGIFDLESRVISKELASLKTTIESSLPISTINPAFQWAQSPSEIFLNVKFAHKLDAPATLNVEAQNVSLDSTSLALKASNGRKLFVLDLELYVFPSKFNTMS